MASCVRPEFLVQLLVGQRLVNRVEVLALDVLDERHLQKRSLLPCADLANHDRHAHEAGHLSGAPAPLASDDLEALAALLTTIG